jgi:hypothetical protein
MKQTPAGKWVRLARPGRDWVAAARGGLTLDDSGTRLPMLIFPDVVDLLMCVLIAGVVVIMYRSATARR